jgi:hypothetical protein
MMMLMKGLPFSIHLNFGSMQQFPVSYFLCYRRSGKIVAVSEVDSMKWPGSRWRSLLVCISDVFINFTLNLNVSSCLASFYCTYLYCTPLKSANINGKYSCPYHTFVLGPMHCIVRNNGWMYWLMNNSPQGVTYGWTGRGGYSSNIYIGLMTKLD